MILVTGATGNLGKSVIKYLKKIIPLDQFIATSSSSDGVIKLKEEGFQARLANFNVIDSLYEAFSGIDKLLLISTMEKNRFDQHKNVIDAAKNQGVKHIVYTSLAIKDIQNSAVKDLMFSHFQTEIYLKKSGLLYTILRNTMYADALTQILGENGAYQSINLPGGDGKVPYALRREIGEATANLLVQADHENKIYNITGSESYNYNEVAKTLKEITGLDIDYNNIPENNFNEFLKSIGFQDFLIYLYAGTIKDIKDKQYEIEDFTLEQLLGRPTASLKEIIREIFKV